ncbi:BrnT family toxin [Brevundimonas sp.]|uniref:BrnT family toxin n=1 Tax=Brevundimonas sp. TaxID=1871086 RepID=UPI0035649C2A
MKVTFDPRKDEANLAKHGISLGRAEDMVVEVVVPDPFPGEPRWRAFGTIEGKPFCLIFVDRDHRRRAINLRRAHAKEYVRYVRPH